MATFTNIISFVSANIITMLTTNMTVQMGTQKLNIGVFIIFAAIGSLIFHWLLERKE